MTTDEALKEIIDSFDIILSKCQTPKHRYLTPEWVRDVIPQSDYWNSSSVLRLEEICSQLSEFDFKTIERKVLDIQTEYGHRFLSKMQRVEPTKLE